MTQWVKRLPGQSDPWVQILKRHAEKETCLGQIKEPMDAQGRLARLTMPAKRRARRARRARQKVTPKSGTSVHMHWHPCAPSTRTCPYAHTSHIIHTQISEQIKCCLYVGRLGFRTRCESECKKENTSFANNQIYGVDLKSCVSAQFIYIVWRYCQLRVKAISSLQNFLVTRDT